MAGELILVVDDNPTNLKLARLLLVGEGYEVVTATDATEARAAVRERHPQLILMDLQMPGVDGFDLTKEIKGDPATRSIPIVAVTSYAMKGDEQRALAAGCDEYVAKPIDTRTLPAVVARQLAGEPR
jgi:CheY-like chemotaxis protein